MPGGARAFSAKEMAVLRGTVTSAFTETAAGPAGGRGTEWEGNV